MVKKICGIVLCMFGIFSGVTAQDNVVDRIIEIGLTDNRTMEHLDVLTNRFGGRLIGSDAYDNAADWCVHKFKEWGLEVAVEEVGELPVGFNRGPWFGRMLSEDGMVLNFATPSYTSGTKGVQRGHVLAEPKTKAEFERMKGALKGAWVLVTGTNNGWAIDVSHNGDVRRAAMIAENEKRRAKNRQTEVYNRQNPGTPKELEMMLDEPALFYNEMKEAGILGIIQSSKVPIRALYDRNTINGNMTFDSLPTVPDIKLDERQYNLIAQKVKERQYFLLEFDIRNHFKMGPVKYHNILGIIRGAEFPDEYVMLGGHLDAFDVGTGGVDCGSGVTPVMEAARLIMKAGGKPKRTIIFCLWAGEEFGLLGSKSWVENNRDKLPKISNYFNRDSEPTVPSSLSVPEAMYADMARICEPLKGIDPDFPFVLNKMGGPMDIPRAAGGSDHAYFMMNAVPAISFGLTDPKGYDFDYQEVWHTGRDTYNKAIAEYQEYAAIVTAVVAYGVADLDHQLSREGLYKPR